MHTLSFREQGVRFLLCSHVIHSNTSMGQPSLQDRNPQSETCSRKHGGLAGQTCRVSTKQWTRKVRWRWRPGKGAAVREERGLHATPPGDRAAK